ncbi:MAG: hypothetical protein RL477_581 [Pseudomonadota bacterium]|jgi:SAM-dependent methyltransferase
MSAASLSDRQLEILATVFGAPARLDGDHIVIGEKRHRVIDGVVIVDDMGREEAAKEEVVRSFGAEWTTFSQMTPEHQAEFDAYFDLIDVPALAGKAVADLGCGMGRWSRILMERTRPRFLVCADLSEAIFVARENLKDHDNVVFLRADLEKLAFPGFRFDLAFSLGVLHHIPAGPERALANIAGYCERFLCYLYYALDNRGAVFAALFRLADGLRRALTLVRNEAARRSISWLLAVFLYKPFVILADVAGWFGVDKERLPLNAYCGNSLARIQQDAYDRFFTSVEHRYSRADVRALTAPHWRDIVFSDRQPYWHFLCMGPKERV